MTDVLRWGIISTGSIASSFAQAINHLPHATIAAVGSRSQTSADEFGQQYDIPNRHDSYEALVNDETVDVVYIGTPHVYHKENMLLALNAGKHVLCEKPFTINAEEAEECINLAREKGLFLMEAVWMRYIPAIVRLRERIAEGAIGDVMMVQADLNFKLDSDPENRIYNPDLGGGALLDVGIYPISFATMLLGFPDKVSSHAKMASTGVDEQVSMLFHYDSGQSALLSGGVSAALIPEARIKGTEGYIRVHANFHHPQKLTIQRDGAHPEELQIPYESTGLNYEAAEVQQCIAAGKLESDIMPLDHTLKTMQLMDSLRADWGLKYPTET